MQNVVMLQEQRLSSGTSLAALASCPYSVLLIGSHYYHTLVSPPQAYARSILPQAVKLSNTASPRCVLLRR
jgi:hypothetical protein